MNPILRDRKSLFLYLFVWSALAVLFASLLALPGKISWEGAIIFSLPMMIVYAFISLSAWYICRAFPLHETNIAMLLGVLLLSALLSSAAWELLGFGWIVALDWLHPSFAMRAWQREMAVLLAGTGVALFLLSTAVHYLLLTFETSREAERKALELHVLARDAELKALRAQINPHFLFNSLNSISALTTSQPQAARSMTLKLADFLRLSMDLGARTTIALEQELALALHFLDVEKIRFGDRLTIETVIEDASLAHMVPPLILQPLVENAVGHGIAHLLEGGTVRISACRHGNELQVAIDNPVDPGAPASKGTGVGLENVRQRVHRLYGPAGRVETRSDGGHFSVLLCLPEK